LKNLKTTKGQHDKFTEEFKEVTKGPEIDGLSNQIVAMMDERKGTETYDRLHKYGHDK